MNETPDVQRSTDYEHAIGPNAGYYLKHFQDLDAGGSKGALQGSATVEERDAHFVPALF